MSFASIKDWLADIAILIFSWLLLYMAYLIVIEGAVPTRFEGGYHTFNGFERILGLAPLLFGGLVQYLIWAKIKCRLFVKDRYWREYGSRRDD